MYAQFAFSAVLWAIGIPTVTLCEGSVYAYATFVSDSFGWNDAVRAMSVILHV
jgi:hypothetical protein